VAAEAGGARRYDVKIESIDYRTDIIGPYCQAIHACRTVAELTAVLREWQELCPDALEAAAGLDDATWRWVLAHTKQAKHAERIAKLAGSILLPLALLEISMVATRFRVPDGCAFIRLREAGRLGHLEPKDGDTEGTP